MAADPDAFDGPFIYSPVAGRMTTKPVGIPTIPFDMMKQVLFIGNAEELAGQFEGYAENGLEHFVLATLTGVVGGMDEITARGADLPQLMAALRDL